MKIMETLDRPIAFHRAFVTLTGSITAALMLSQAVYWSRRTRDKDGWFYKTIEEWQEETGLTRHEQAGARKTLKKLGFWEEKLKGVPATTHYRLDAEKLQSSMPQTGKLDGQEMAVKIDDLQPTNTETTPETTTSSTTNVVEESSGKISDLEKRKKDFGLVVIQTGTLIYTRKMLDNFIGYWAEPNGARKQRMKWEKEREKEGWDLERRLKTWATNNFDKIQCYLTEAEKTIAHKRKDFAVSMIPYRGKYTADQLNKFYAYWTQPENKPEPERIRWETEEFWDLGQRLTQWAQNNQPTYTK